MQIFTDITALIGLVRAKSWFAAVILLAKVIGEIGQLVPQPTPAQLATAHALLPAGDHTGPLLQAIETECAACQASGSISPALLALLLKLAPFLLALLGV